MQHEYQTRGVCSRSIRFQLDDGIIRSVEFSGGCNGNLKGISKLVEGQRADNVIKLLEGNTCGSKLTSCPDQLACALKEALAQEAQLG